MSFHVVYGDDRAIPGESNSVGEPTTNHERADEARPGRISHCIGPFDAGVRQHLRDQWQQAANMVPGRDLGDNPAIHRVQIDLAVQRLCNETPLGAIDRDTRLVAARFDAQNIHLIGTVTHFRQRPEF